MAVSDGKQDWGSCYRVAETAESSPAGPPVDAGVLTIPNGLSALRLLGVPVFLWLMLGPHADVIAVALLAASGFTDWLDGLLARRLNQQSSFGALLDPLADRLYILATLVGLVLRHIIPPELAAVLILRDALLLLMAPGLRRRGHSALPVHYLGKAATFSLLYAFPLLLLGSGSSTASQVAKPVAWGFTIWGTAMYLWAGVIYFAQYRDVVRRQPL